MITPFKPYKGTGDVTVWDTYAEGSFQKEVKKALPVQKFKQYSPLMKYNVGRVKENKSFIPIQREQRLSRIRNVI